MEVEWYHTLGTLTLGYVSGRPHFPSSFVHLRLVLKRLKTGLRPQKSMYLKVILIRLNLPFKTVNTLNHRPLTKL